MNKVTDRYSTKGTVYLDKAKTPFLNKELVKLENCCNEVKKEFIKIGDAGEPNHLWVGRFMSDKDRPRLLNKTLAIEVIKILDNYKVKDFIKKVIGF